MPKATKYLGTFQNSGLIREVMPRCWQNVAEGKTADQAMRPKTTVSVPPEMRRKVPM